MRDTLRVRARYMKKSLLRPLLFKYPPIGLQPERLYLWLDTLLATRDVPGSVLEIGCASGGTAAYSQRMLQRLGIPHEYVCIDTFRGFVESQFQADGFLGTPQASRHEFSASSLPLVRRILNGLGANDVRLIEGDIVAMPSEDLPGEVAACLIDVDLSHPVSVALGRVVERLSPGGVILVDDCPDESSWKARTGYDSFVRDAGLLPEYRFGMGIVRMPG